MFLQLTLSYTDSRNRDRRGPALTQLLAFTNVAIQNPPVSDWVVR